MKLNWNYLSREQRIEAVKDGVSRGLSTRLIAEELGCSKNAIIGCANRYNIQLAPSKYHQKRERKPQKPIWSAMGVEKKVQFLQEAFAAGKSVTDIVGMVENATVKAIERCAERNGISRRVEKRTRASRTSEPRRQAKPKEPPAVISKPYKREHRGPVNIVDLLPWQCRAPQWEDKPKRPLRSPDDWMYCGALVKPGSSYCEACHEKFWVKPDRPVRFDRRHMNQGYARAR